MKNSSFRKSGGRSSFFYGFLLFLGFGLGVSMSAFIFYYWRISLLNHRYFEEVFLIDSVGFGKMKKSGSANIPIAEGMVNGIPEEVSLLEFGVDIATVSELERQFPKGSQLKILYDPTAMKSYIQGRTLRVIPISTNFKVTWFKALGLTLIPGVFLLTGGMGIFVYGRKNR